MSRIADAPQCLSAGSAATTVGAGTGVARGTSSTPNRVDPRTPARIGWSPRPYRRETIMADPDDTRICVDRVLPDETHPAAAAAHRAVAEAAALAEGTPAAEIDAAGVIPVARLALIRLKMWENGKTLRCRFLDGEATQREKAQAKAQIWEQYANVDFQFVDDGDAEIRISFSADPGSWSAIGTDALVEAYFPKHQPTMNFGWLRADTADEEYERVVVHEFGHALGAIHEHQSPSAGLKWDK